MWVSCQGLGELVYYRVRKMHGLAIFEAESEKDQTVGRALIKRNRKNVLRPSNGHAIHRKPKKVPDSPAQSGNIVRALK